MEISFLMFLCLVSYLFIHSFYLLHPPKNMETCESKEDE